MCNDQVLRFLKKLCHDSYFFFFVLCSSIERWDYIFSLSRVSDHSVCRRVLQIIAKFNRKIKIHFFSPTIVLGVAVVIALALYCDKELTH